MVKYNIQKNRRDSVIQIHMEYELYQINDYIVQYYNHIIYILIYLWSARYKCRDFGTRPTLLRYVND